VYYILSLVLTAAFSLAIAGGALVAIYQPSPGALQAPLLVALVVMAVVVLNWARDRLQRLIDRKFFREKFQLDKALQRMNQSAGSMVDPAALAQRMLISCRDLLGVDPRGPVPAGRNRRHVPADRRRGDRPGSAEILDRTSSSWDCCTKTPASADSMPRIGETASQILLQQLDVDLVHALEVDGQLAGALILGAKRSGNAIHRRRPGAAHLAGADYQRGAAFGGGVHQAVARLNDELQIKVDKITEQQRLISMLQAEITSRQQVAAPAESVPFRRELIKGSSPAITRCSRRCGRSRAASRR